MIEQTAAVIDSGVNDDGFRRIVFAEGRNCLSEFPLNQSFTEESDDLTKNEIINIKQEAYSEGFEKGKKIGKESEKKIVISVVDELREAVVELEEFKKLICKNAEKAAVKLAFSIAGKILRTEIEKNNNFVIKIIKEALKKIMDDENVRIKINPSDLSYIQNAGSLQFSDILAGSSVTFEADSEIARGGCLVETDSGGIDARIDSQLMVIEETFSEELSK
jgi:flagellar assembly protein FliH